MNEILLLKGNPSRRSGGRKRRSAAQRAATKRMIAANRSGMRRNPSRKSRKARTPAVSAPRRSSRRSSRRSAVHSASVGGSGIAKMLQTGAIMGGGALVSDIGMGLIAKFMPTMTTLTNRVNADGTVNYGYYATKAALIYGIGKYGTRVTRYAPTMAAGAITVMAYELFRTMMPTDGTIPLGYFNPGRIVTGGNLGRIMRNPNSTGIPANNGHAGLGRIMNLPVGTGKGAVASATVRNLGRVR